jgi:hypothetical protein
MSILQAERDELLSKLHTPIATAAAGFIKARYSTYTKAIDALNKKVRQVETQRAAEELRGNVAMKRNAEFEVEHEGLKAKHAKIIDEMDAEARASDDTLHDMGNRQNLDRDDIEEKQRSIDTYRLKSENDEGKIVEMQKTIVEMQKKIDEQEGLIGIHDSDDTESLRCIKNLQENHEKEIHRKEISFRKLNKEIELMKSEHANMNFFGCPKTCFIFTFTGTPINPHEINALSSSMKNAQGFGNPLSRIIDTVKDGMHFCKMTFVRARTALFYYKVIEKYCDVMKSKYSAYNMVYGPISLPEQIEEWKFNIAKKHISTLPTTSACSPDFNWI